MKNLGTNYFKLLKTVVIALVIWWVLKRIDLPSLLSSIGKSDPRWILLAAFFIFFNLGSQWLKWHILTGIIVPERSVGLTIKSFLGGITLGIVTPGRIGEFGRAVFFERKKWLELTGLFFIDKYMNFTALISFSLLTTILFRNRLIDILSKTSGENFLSGLILSSGKYRLDIIFFASLLLFSMSGWLFPEKFSLFLEKVLSLGSEKLRKRFSRLLMGLKLLDHGRAWKVMLLSFSFYFAALVQFYALVAGFGHTISFSEIIFTFSVMVISSSIPLIPGGFGTREAGAILSLGLCGISAEAALAAATCIYIFNVAIPAVFGWIILVRSDISGRRAVEDLAEGSII